MSRARDIADFGGSASSGGITGKNKLQNGQFAVAQRGTTFASGDNNDAAYTLDRWKIFSDGNDVIDVSQETTTIPTNRLFAASLDVETANKKFGIAQIVEHKNCVGLIGGKVTLSFQAKVSDTSKLDNVKAAIISWSSTADSPTTDMISAWGSEGTNPTLASNFTYENTPANLSVTTSYAKYSVTANVDTSGAKNIIVFIWSDVTDTTAGHFLYVTDVQLEAGDTATDYEHKKYSDDLKECLRYFYKLRKTNAYGEFVTIRTYSTDDGTGIIYFPQPMRVQPTLTIDKTVNATNFAYDLNSISIAASDVNVTQVGIAAASSSGSAFSTGGAAVVQSNGASGAIDVSFDFASEL